LAFSLTLSDGSALAENRPAYFTGISASTMASTHLANSIAWRLRKNNQSPDVIGRRRALDIGRKRRKQDSKTNHSDSPCQVSSSRHDKHDLRNVSETNGRESLAGRFRIGLARANQAPRKKCGFDPKRP
jgi:hypothetical protein